MPGRRRRRRFLDTALSSLAISSADRPVSAAMQRRQIPPSATVAMIESRGSARASRTSEAIVFAIDAVTLRREQENLFLRCAFAIAR
jgi:hypothetical protein